MKNTSILFTIFLLLFFSCKKDTDPEIPLPPEQDFFKVHISNKKFIDSEGQEMIPWGVNYTNAADGVDLIDDHWYDDEIFEIIKEDFLEIKALGANIIRIHLQYHKFMINRNIPNDAALDRLLELVEFAEANKIYLDITGLGAYRKSDQPTFYETISDSNRWRTQAIFWQSIAQKLNGNPAVFAFNLMNEPVVSVGCDTIGPCEWLNGDGLGGFHFVQNITRTSGNTYAPTLKDWIRTMTEAIKSEDDQTLITVGLLALGPFNQFASDVDFISTHIYPKTGELEVSVNKVLDNQSSVPLVIEETYNLNCTVAELTQFISDIDGNYNGLMGHYFGTKLEDLDESDIGQAVQKNFLEFLIEHNPN